MKQIIAIGAATLFLAACARSESVEDIPQEAEVAQAELADGLAEDGEQTTPGSWQPGVDGSVQSIAFQAPNGELLLGIRCDDRGGLIVRRPGLISRGNLALLQMRTGDTVRRLAVTTSVGSNPQVQATVPYNDQLIGGLIRFTEPLEVRFEGLDTLVLPPNPAVGELARACQRGVGSAAAAAAAAEAVEAPDAQPEPEPAQ